MPARTKTAGSENQTSTAPAIARVTSPPRLCGSFRTLPRVERPVEQNERDEDVGRILLELGREADQGSGKGKERRGDRDRGRRQQAHGHAAEEQEGREPAEKRHEAQRVLARAEERDGRANEREKADGDDLPVVRRPEQPGERPLEDRRRDVRLIEPERSVRQVLRERAARPRPRGATASGARRASRPSAGGRPTA